MPPKRRISVPLEPPKLKQKSFGDTPATQTKSRGMSSATGSDTASGTLSAPPYVELRKKPEFFLGLALAALRCVSVGVVHSRHAGARKILQDKLKNEHVVQLAWLIQNVGSVRNHAPNHTPTGGPKHREPKKVRRVTPEVPAAKQNLLELGTELMDMVHEMIMSDSSRHLLHDVLLHELGLTAKCWSLAIPPASLSVLGRVLVCRLYWQNQEESAEGAEDDPLLVGIWRG